MTYEIHCGEGNGATGLSNVCAARGGKWALEGRPNDRGLDTRSAGGSQCRKGSYETKAPVQGCSFDLAISLGVWR
jgi:hypothetical protein